MVSAILHKKNVGLKKNRLTITKIALFGSISMLIIIVPILIYNLFYFGKIYPNIFVAGVNVGGLTPQNAAFLISQNTQVPSNLTFVSEDQRLSLKTKDIALSYDYSSSVERAYFFGRTGNFFYDILSRIDLFFHPKNFGLSTNINEESISKIISVFAGQISVDARDAKIEIVNGAVKVDRGQPGKEIDQEYLRALIGQHLSFLDSTDIAIPIKIIDNTLDNTEYSMAQTRGDKFIGKSLKIIFEDQAFVYPDNKLVAFLDPRGGLKNNDVTSVATEIESKVGRLPQNPKFTFDNGKVSEFLPALDGIKVNQQIFITDFYNTFDLIENGDQKNYSFEVPVTRTPPEVTTGEVNNLGINNLIGRGSSTYFHSISTRVHNVVLASNRINGTLVKPGDTFSFNDTLGDVSKFTGYQQAYIISEGKTILGDGGGVCQVSTTLFRAILNAGLPVIERQAHAYRVGYYEQNSPPGFDATVYGPSPDLKFINDTPGYILIEAFANPKNYSLVFELYGSDDGRVATVSKPIVSNVTPPPADVYQDDPTLPTGSIKQIDFKAWGAKVSFNYKVIRNGETLINKTFTSNYRPWQAIYLRGTGPAN